MLVFSKMYRSLDLCSRACPRPALLIVVVLSVCWLVRRAPPCPAPRQYTEGGETGFLILGTGLAASALAREDGVSTENHTETRGQRGGKPSTPRHPFLAQGRESGSNALQFVPSPPRACGVVAPRSRVLVPPNQAPPGPHPVCKTSRPVSPALAYQASIASWGDLAGHVASGEGGCCCCAPRAWPGSPRFRGSDSRVCAPPTGRPSSHPNSPPHHHTTRRSKGKRAKT
jgi:hypothetical protein